MTKTPILKTRNRLAKIYGVGILAFTAIFGSITVMAKFMAHLNLA